MSNPNKFEYINQYYGLDVSVGTQVRYSGGNGAAKTGTVTGAKGQHLLIKMNGDAKAEIYHPTWQMDYPENEVTA